MKNLSRFDLGMIIAFVVVALLGAGAWWYLSSALVSAQADVTAAAGDFDKFSKQQVFLPTRSNQKTLQNNIAVMTAQLDPIEKSTLQAPGNKLSSIQTLDTVTWKHQLDDEVRRLNSSAKLHGIDVPTNFYYGFSRYLDKNPPEEATAVLTRQQLAIEQIATILIEAPVRAVVSVKRTMEEDPDQGTAGNNNNPKLDSDALAGGAILAPGGVYTAYPFEVEFDTTTEGFRKVIDGLMQSPYVFVIRGLTVQNQHLNSPKIHDLDQMAGTANSSAPSLVASSPGEVAARSAVPTVGPQFLFGGETLRVRARIDLIEWHGISTGTAASNPGGSSARRSDNHG